MSKKRSPEELVSELTTRLTALKSDLASGEVEDSELDYYEGLIDAYESAIGLATSGGEG